MRRLIIAMTVAAILFAMTQCTQEPTVDTADCYRCYQYVEKIRCDTTEVYVIIEALKCGWSEEDIAQYAKKGTFTVDEKCYFLIQRTECYIENN